MNKNEKIQRISVTGIITASEWDEDDNVVGVTLSTPDEEEYLIDSNGKGEELLDFVSQNVKVVGIIEENDYGDKIITVKSYEVFEDE